MIVKQSTIEAISPIKSLEVEAILDSPGSVIEGTHRSVKYNTHTSATYHNQYLAFGATLPVEIVSQSVEDALDISEWPKIKRNLGVNAVVEASFSNCRAATSTRSLDLRTFSGSSFTSPAHEILEETLLEYTFNIVNTIADSMASNQMWNSSGNRAQTSVIPHEYLTGHVWNGLWGGGAGIQPTSGRRFMPITRRHLAACGHYQYNVGQKVYFKDINNNVIEKTVIRVVNLLSELYAAGLPAYDISITLLDSDLPESIHILPVIGNWGRGIVGTTADTYTQCDQIAGFCLRNNDGHIVPFMTAWWFDQVIPLSPFTYEGINFHKGRIKGIGGGGNTTSIPAWPSQEPTDKFYHNRRGGDSGSPYIVPCAEGWCYSGHDSTNCHPDPELFNELIDLIDTRQGISTGYEVAVATDPTL